MEDLEAKVLEQEDIIEKLMVVVHEEALTRNEWRDLMGQAEPYLREAAVHE